MIPPVRDQVSAVVQRERVGISFPVSEDLTRQEFREEADTMSVLRRAGANLFARPASYGVNDFDTDLLAIKEATRRAVDGFSSLPETVRRRYATQEALLRGLAAGELFLTPDGLVVPEEGGASAAPDAGTGQAEGAAGAA